MASRNQSIESLKARVSDAGGFAQSNLFMVELPQITRGPTSEELNLVCTSVTLPSRQINTQTRPFGVTPTQYGYGYQTGNVTMSFRVMNDQKIRSYFQTWQNLIIRNDDPDRAFNEYSVGYYKNYVKTVKINQLRKGIEFPVFNKQFDIGIPPEIQNRLPSLSASDLPGPLGQILGGGIDFSQQQVSLSLGAGDDTVYTHELFEAYPVTFQQETLADGNQNGISQITVEFAFRDFTGYTSKADKDTRNTVKAINFLGKLFNVF